MTVRMEMRWDGDKMKGGKRDFKCFVGVGDCDCLRV